MQDLVTLMGSKYGVLHQGGDQLGMLQPGRLADIILLDGNPLEGY
jgi:imidazolonepropionase-like amidohydrolase